MAIQTQLVEQLMQGGLNEAIDSRLLPQGNFITIDNLIYNEAGSLGKRSGLRALGYTGPSGFLNPTFVEGLHRYGNEMLATQWQDGSAGSSPASPILASLVETETGAKWLGRGAMPPFAVRRKPLVRSNKQIFNGQSATTGDGVTVYTWIDQSSSHSGTPSLYYRVVDQATGAVLTNDTLLYAATIGNSVLTYKIVSSQGVPALVINDFPTLKGFKWLGRSFSGVPVVLDAGTGSYNQTATVYFDFMPADAGGAATFVLARQRDKATLVSGGTAADRHNLVTTYDALFHVIATVDLGPMTAGTGTTNPGPMGITCCSDGTRVYVAWGCTDGAVTYDELVQSSLATTTSALIQNVVSSFGLGMVLGSNCSVTDVTSSPSTMYLNVTASDSAGSGFRSTTTYTITSFTNGGTISTVGRCWNSSQQSTPFFFAGCPYAVLCVGYGNVFPSAGTSGSKQLARSCVWSLHDQSAVQPCHIAADLAPDSVATVDAQPSYPYNNAPSLPPRGIGGFDFVYIVQSGIAGKYAIDHWYLNGAQFDPCKYRFAEANGTLYMSGGITTFYDGLGVYEAGFLGSPEAIALNTTNAGAMTGTFSYLLCWEYWDNRGNIHRSQLSDPISTGAMTAQQVMFTALDLGCTLFGIPDDGANRKVQLGIYRTINAGTTYFRLNPPVENGAGSFAVDLLPGDFSIFGLAITDNTTDSALQALGYGTIYADPLAGILDAEAPPASLDIHTHLNRIWLISGEDDHELWFSNLVQAGTAVSWNSVLTLRIDDSIDGATALASLDSMLLVFTPTKIYVVSGNGPNETGVNSDYQTERVISNVGCSNPKSVIEYENGVLFQATSGHFYQVDRKLGVTYIGQPVENSSEGYRSCMGAALDDLSKSVFWVCTSSTPGITRCFVYDYRSSAWSTWTLAEGTFSGAVSVDAFGLKYFGWINGSTAADIVRESPSVFVDGAVGANVTTTLEFPWVHLGALSGFQRVRRLMIVGEASYGTTITAHINYDYMDAGAASYVWGVTGAQPMQTDFHLSKQKCAAIKVKLTSQSFAPSVGLNYTSVAWETGVLQGREKWSQSNRGTPQ